MAQVFRFDEIRRVHSRAEELERKLRDIEEYVVTAKGGLTLTSRTHKSFMLDEISAMAVLDHLTRTHSAELAKVAKELYEMGVSYESKWVNLSAGGRRKKNEQEHDPEA